MSERHLRQSGRERNWRATMNKRLSTGPRAFRSARWIA